MHKILLKYLWIKTQMPGNTGWKPCVWVLTIFTSTENNYFILFNLLHIMASNRILQCLRHSLIIPKRHFSSLDATPPAVSFSHHTWWVIHPPKSISKFVELIRFFCVFPLVVFIINHILSIPSNMDFCFWSLHKSVYMNDKHSKYEAMLWFCANSKDKI